MPADLQAIDAVADMVGMMDGPAREPEHLALELAQDREIIRAQILDVRHLSHCSLSCNRPQRQVINALHRRYAGLRPAAVRHPHGETVVDDANKVTRPMRVSAPPVFGVVNEVLEGDARFKCILLNQELVAEAPDIPDISPLEITEPGGERVVGASAFGSAELFQELSVLVELIADRTGCVANPIVDRSRP